MKAPRYHPSRVTTGLQQRIIVVLLVALFAMVCGFLSYPYVRKAFYVRQLHGPDAGGQVRALNAVTRLAVEDAGLRDVIEQSYVDLLSESDSGPRSTAIRIAGWAIVHVPGMRERLDERLDAADDVLFLGLAAALREADVWDIDERGAEQRCRWSCLRCRTADVQLLSAALRDLGHAGPQCAVCAEDVLGTALAHNDAVVRQAAVEAISMCLPQSRVSMLQQVTNDTDPAVRREAETRLSALRWSIEAEATLSAAEIEALIARLGRAEYGDRLQIIDALAAAAPAQPGERQLVIEALRQVVDVALAAGNGGLAGSALLVLAGLEDQAYLPVMLDVSAGYADQPMLRFMAARAARRLDADAGSDALINLFAQESDVVRDLAAFEVAAQPGNPAIERLKSELYSTDLEVRGPAALALALSGKGDAPVRDLAFRELLHQRTLLKVDNIHAEVEWKPRGYYLCALLALGEQDVRPDVDLFLLNENFPRLAVYAALLHSGESDVLDAVLGSDPERAAELVPLLRDQRFGDVIARYFPGAPVVEWAVPPDQREAQVARLIRWWSIFHRQIEFDPLAHAYQLAGAARPTGL